MNPDPSPQSLIGRPVFDIEVRRLGAVTADRGDVLVVEGGTLRHRRFLVPREQIQAAVPDGVFLSLPLRDYAPRRR